MEKASVVIPTKNRLYYLKPCLRALKNQKGLRKKLDIIVVDDCSSDGTKKYLEEISKEDKELKIRCLNGGGRGPASARNIGWKESEAENILFIDDDCEPSAFWASDLLVYLEQESGLSGVGGTILGKNNSTVGAYIDYAGYLKHPGQPKDAYYLVSANSSFRRKDLQEIGGFSEEFPIAGGEDPDLAFRMKKQGKRLGIVLNGIVYHNHPKTLFDLYKMGKRYGRGEFFLCQAGHNIKTSRGTAKTLFREIKNGFKRKSQKGLNQIPFLNYLICEIVFKYAMMNGYCYQQKISAL